MVACMMRPTDANVSSIQISQLLFLLSVVETQMDISPVVPVTFSKAVETSLSSLPSYRSRGMMSP